MNLNQKGKTNFILLPAGISAARALELIRQAPPDTGYVIIEQIVDAQRVYYLFSKDQFARQLEAKQDLQLAQAADLANRAPTRKLSADTPEQEIFPGTYILLEHDHPVAYLIIEDECNDEEEKSGAYEDHYPEKERAELDNPFPEPASAPYFPGEKEMFDRNIAELPDFSAAEPPEPERFDRSIPAGAVPPAPAPQPAASGETKEAFEAYPFISDPGLLEPGQRFQVTIKFSRENEQSDDLDVAGAFRAEQPQENDFAEVTLMASGATIENNGKSRLFLDLRSSATYDCVVHDKATQVTLFASFFYKGQPMTMATRQVQVGAAPAIQPVFHAVQDDDAQLCALNIKGVYYEKDAIDITAGVIVDSTGKKLIWEIFSSQVEDGYHQQEIEIGDTRSFARDLGVKMASVSFAGKLGGKQVLETLGQNIADFMPAALFDMLQQVFEKTGAPPRLLIWTEEPYIPWELAYDRRLAFDPGYDPILALQVCVGRWLKKKRVVYPLPATLEISTFSAMAGDYSGFDYSALEEAVEEKKFLVSRFQAKEVEARREKLLALTGCTPALPGHLLHLALHGLSKPDLNEQLIILQDGELGAENLIGAYACGDTPAVAFLFLNACQVGTPGDTLGQASGFPGVLLSKGTMGFIAPLWDVHDRFARHFSEAFYEETLGKGRPVGDVLLDLRRKYRENWPNTLTHLAYIYYGHPGLRLRIRNEK